MNYVNQFLDDEIRVFGVDRDKPTVIFEREPDMIAEHELGEGSTDYVDDDMEEDNE